MNLEETYGVEFIFGTLGEVASSLLGLLGIALS